VLTQAVHGGAMSCTLRPPVLYRLMGKPHAGVGENASNFRFNFKNAYTDLLHVLLPSADIG